MHNDAMTNPQQPLFDAAAKVRVTVPVTTDTLELFKRLAAVQGTSVGKAMGEWLADTGDAVESMTALLADARRSPIKVARQMEAYAHGLTDLTSGLLDELRAKARQGAPRAADGADGKRSAAAPAATRALKKALTPPVSNTGGKVSGARSPKGSK